MAKKQSTLRQKRDVLKVEGQKPDIRPASERIAIMARVERYLLGTVFLKRMMRLGFMSKQEYRRLSSEYADCRGLPKNSMFRGFLES